MRAGHEKCTAQVLPRLGEVPEDCLQVLCKFNGVLGDILPLQTLSLFFCPQSPSRRPGGVSAFTHPRAGALIQGTIMPRCPAVVANWLCSQLSCRTFLSCKTLKSAHQDSSGIARQRWKFRLDCTTSSWLSPDQVSGVDRADETPVVEVVQSPAASLSASLLSVATFCGKSRQITGRSKCLQFTELESQIEFKSGLGQHTMVTSFRSSLMQSSGLQAAVAGERGKLPQLGVRAAPAGWALSSCASKSISLNFLWGKCAVNAEVVFLTI